MRYTLSDFSFRFFLTVLLLLLLEIIGATVLPSLFSYHYRFFFLGVVCIYMALEIPSSLQPYTLLILCWVHSIFSVEGWAINCLIALVLMVILSVIKDLIQLSTYFSKVFFYFVGLFFWDLLRVIIISLKSNAFDGFLVLITDDLIANLILALITPFLLLPLTGIWKVYKSIET